MTENSGPLILNVDDQDAQLYVKTRDLKGAGFTVIEARTGAEALRLVQSERPIAVLLDVQLPDLDGHKVCAFIKEKWPEVMVLMTSATFTTSEDRTLGLDSGADTYLVQPSEPLELVAALRALLRIRVTEDALRTLNATLEQRVQDRIAELNAVNTALKAEITQRRKAETALLQAQKMEAVGQLTGGLAHDFNNLLTAVVGNLDLIKARASDQRIIRLAENAYKAAERGAKLTSQLLAFSRTQKLTTAPIDVNSLIEHLRDMLHQSLGAQVRLQTNLSPSLPAATADANQLELAILNLSINARDAMAEGGTLTIRTALGSPDRVLITVSDTGCGMSPEVLARAFDPFFTTKPPGRGTGLGLSQVYGIIKQIGGDVSIKSEIGRGTEVTLVLPRASDQVHTHSIQSSEVERGRHEKLLVVDDDDDVRSIMSSVLSEIGYVVAEAVDGSSALTMFDEFRPHLVVADFAMPGMTGGELSAALRRREPNVRVLLVTGFADSSAIEQIDANAHVLRKPFRPAELATAVRAALDL